MSNGTYILVAFDNAGNPHVAQFNSIDEAIAAKADGQPAFIGSIGFAEIRTDAYFNLPWNMRLPKEQWIRIRRFADEAALQAQIDEDMQGSGSLSDAIIEERREGP